MEQQPNQPLSLSVESLLARRVAASLTDELFEVIGTEGDEHAPYEMVHYRTDDFADALADYARIWPKADNIRVLNPEKGRYEELGEEEIHRLLGFIGFCGDRTIRA